MENKETEFSWSGLFFVTGLCSFLFTGIIKILDGTDSLLFLVIGITTFFLWIMNRAGRMLLKSPLKEENK